MARLPDIARTGGRSGAPDGGVPATREDRVRLREALRRAASGLVAPVGLAELSRRAQEVLDAQGLDGRSLRYAVVLLSNEVWRDALAAVPFERRLLLLPQCIRDAARCKAPVDKWGLACRQCGPCRINELLSEAKALGYVTLVAEGSAVVTSLLESGRIEGVIGVSCLSMLEKVFPYMEAAAVPGLAIPLLSDGCEDTSLDLEWVQEAIRLRSQSPGEAPNPESLRSTVMGWFTRDSLDAVMGSVGSGTEKLARQWLLRGGKRWRPLLAACAYHALDERPGVACDDLRRLAVAVECFHKASLVHDDIEDGDDLRDELPTMHAEVGVPLALNVGDFLLGEGYRMIAECLSPPDRKARMLDAAARGHRELCLGQGAELCWSRQRGELSSLQVLDIFRRKTAPAFDVALHLGAICAGADQDVSVALRSYSDCLGVAYQIHDDIRDFLGGTLDLKAMRPSIMLALACESAEGEDRRMLEDAMALREVDDSTRARLEGLMVRLQVEPRASRLLGHYAGLAVRSLAPIRREPLKIVLRRVVSGIFGGMEMIPCCEEILREARGA